MKWLFWLGAIVSVIGIVSPIVFGLMSSPDMPDRTASIIRLGIVSLAAVGWGVATMIRNRTRKTT